MNPVFIFIFLCLITTNYASAQNIKSRTIPTVLTVEPSSLENAKTKKTSNSESEKNTVNAEAYKFLGLDLNASPQDYANAKEKLYYEDPKQFEEFKKILQKQSSSVQKQSITRDNYNALPIEKKNIIDSNPERYQIID